MIYDTNGGIYAHFLAEGVARSMAKQ